MAIDEDYYLLWIKFDYIILSGKLKRDHTSYERDRFWSSRPYIYKRLEYRMRNLKYKTLIHGHIWGWVTYVCNYR